MCGKRMPRYVTVNHGMEQDKIEILDEHFDSRSAAIRQAVDEFLDRRDLLPDEDEDNSGLNRLVDSSKEE